MIKKEEAYKGVRVIFYLNVFYILVSYLYAIFVGSYNGDFLNVSVNLGLNFLTLIVFFLHITLLGSMENLQIF